MPAGKTFADKLVADGPKKLLSLDGGGILGVISIEFLAEIEDRLREALGKDSSFVLADYFDYFAGTSTGAIIATCLSLGLSASEIRTFYQTSGTEMFDKQWLYRQYLAKYSADNLREILKRVVGDDTELGSDRLRTLLLIVLRNATTDSPWPLSNNPGARYNDRARANCNLKLPLWQVVRASTAAPTFFPPEVVTVGGTPFVFVDGGVTVYNNPAFQLFRMATLGAFRLGWPTGEDKMLLVSIGTGTSRDADPGLVPSQMNLLYSATHVPSALIAAAVEDQDFNCRVFGRCVSGPPLDRERGDLVSTSGTGPLAAGGKLFTYLRYNVDLTAPGLAALGLPQINAKAVQAMDAVGSIPTLSVIGRAAATRDVKVDHFGGFLT